MSHDSEDIRNLPHWNIESVYRGFEDQAFSRDKKRLQENTDTLLSLVREPSGTVREWLERFLMKYNETFDLRENLEAYAYMRFSTNTRDEAASVELNAIEALGVPLHRLSVLFRNALKHIRQEIPSILSGSSSLAPYRFFLQEQLRVQEKQMSPEEEDLAADLSRSGGEAWGRLQEAVSSTLTMPWDDASGERITVVRLRALAHHADRAVRKKAFDLELAAWKQVEIPLAFALNGVKGFSDTLNTRRGYDSTLSRSVFQSRISERTLQSLTEAMQEAFPKFRTYLKAKASALGIQKLAFYDIFAPVRAGTQPNVQEKVWSFEEAREFIVQRFSEFSNELADFAESAFKNGWIDAQPREGKVGGAYCVDVPISGESRILCNFDGSFTSLTTVAHELGHAYHHFVLKDMPHMLRAYPMTLAETASIFSETIVFNGAITMLSGKEKIPILETFLSDSTQIIVDIYSRFLFEDAIMKTRKERELSPAEFCALMIDAQKKTYGDGLDENILHPYMWAVKGHYYRQDLAYYNFPYAFGQLFGLSLYARFKREGGVFAETYKELLRETGLASANDVTRAAGFDIETVEFWRSGIEMINTRIDEFVELTQYQ